MNVDAALRRRLGKATLDWSQAEACPVVPALRNARYMAEAFQLGEGGRRLIELIILSELNVAFADALLQLVFGKRHEIARFQIGRASCRERVVSTCRSRWSPYH